MNTVIGIISYFPDEINLRETRKEKLVSLLKSCDSIFNLPILIIAQNYSTDDLNLVFGTSSNVNLVCVPKLGILGARKLLRSEFLNSAYDYLVMLDDDCELTGTETDGALYVKQLLEHPNGYGIFKQNLLKLFAISKSLFSKIEYPDGEIEQGDFFEDILLFGILQKYYKDKEFVFKRGNLKESSNSADDINSTWFYGQFNKRIIGDKTRKFLKEA